MDSAVARVEVRGFDRGIRGGAAGGRRRPALDADLGARVIGLGWSMEVNRVVMSPSVAGRVRKPEYRGIAGGTASHREIGCPGTGL
jgi:hypothetical protein